MIRKIHVSRILTQWIITAVALLLISFFPGVSLTNWQSAFAAAATIGFMNALLWPLFARFALPLTVATFGLASLLMNGVVVLLAAKILPGFSVANVWVGIGVAFGLSIITTLTRELLVINDDDTFYRNIIKKQTKKYIPTDNKHTPGILFFQIDGLAYDVLQRAIADGNVPTLARWLRNGDYTLKSWETDWSSQTGVSQAGILMGNNEGIPAYRWFEKDTGKSMAFSNPDDLKILESRISNHQGLLSHNGTSRANLLSGDAQYTLLTVSTIKNPNKKNFGEDYYGYFANPYNLTRTIILGITDIIKELRSSNEQKQRDVEPRLEKKGKTYPLLRSWIAIIQRDIVLQTLIADMYKGRDVMYADFVGYDEVSHHTGVERHETLEVLRDIDSQIARLETAAKEAPRPYHLVILSDHGQTQGATFSQRSGYTLQELVQKLTSSKSVVAEMDNDESKHYLQAAVTEASQSKTAAGHTLNTFTKNFQDSDNKVSSAIGEIKVMGSGNLGLIYFTAYDHRLTLEEINNLYPDLIPGLRSQPYIGFILVDSKKYGGVVLGYDGIYYLRDNRVEGVNPLLPFGQNAAEQIRRTNGFKYVGDIMVNSFYDTSLHEVAAFEELVGSHGGLGGYQTHPFILFPHNWYFPKEPVIGAEKVHNIMKHWLADVGQREYGVN